MKRYGYNHVRGTARFLLIPALIFAVWVPDAQAQQSCTEKLAQADELYQNVELDEAIALLTECLNTNEFTEQEKISAYRLLALCYIGNEQPDDARDAIANLLDLDPGYQLDPEQDPPDFQNMVEEYREANEQVRRQPDNRQEIAAGATPQKKRNRTKWLLIGGGAVAGGVVAAVLLGGGGGAKNLPPAPALPGGN